MIKKYLKNLIINYIILLKFYVILDNTLFLAEKYEKYKAMFIYYVKLKYKRLI